MDTTSELKSRLDSLRQRSARIWNAAEIDALLDEARSLLKEVFQTEVEDEARAVFRELRDRKETDGVTAPPGLDSASATRVERLAAGLRWHRSLLESGGGLEDMELAVGGLYSVLRELGPGDDDAGLRREALDGLEAAAGLNAQLQQKVAALLDCPEMADMPEVEGLLDRLVHRPADAASPAPAAESAGAPDAQPGPDILQRMARARRFFYAGDYYEAADALTEVLRLHPGNQEATQRLAQVEDNIRRGIVPDSRVPHEARVAFGRAQSLERAARFDEAREAYRRSLEEARKGGPLLASWQPAIEALLRIDNSLIARETRDEADALLRADRWREAAEKYEIVLRLLPDDTHARERLDMLRTLLDRTEPIITQLNSPTGNLEETGEAAVILVRILKRLRPELDGSRRLGELEQEIAVGAQSLAERLVERSQQLISQARIVVSISGSRSMLGEAVRLLGQARELTPEDAKVFELARYADSERRRLDQVYADLAEAGRLLNLNTAAACRQARDLLARTQEYEQDPVYLQLAASLRSQYLGQAEAALHANEFRIVDYWLQSARGVPFDVLGDSEEALRLERDLAAARRSSGRRPSSPKSIPCTRCLLRSCSWLCPCTDGHTRLVGAPGSAIWPSGWRWGIMSRLPFCCPHGLRSGPGMWRGVPFPNPAAGGHGLYWNA